MMITTVRKKNLRDFCAKLGVDIKDLSILNIALTHSSYSNEKKHNDAPEHNERIEFLGDSVLSLIVSSFLYEEFPTLSEGELSKIRARYVCDQALADYARRINLGKYLQLGKGESMSGGHDRSSILACAFEAVVGACYLSLGWEKTKMLVLGLLAKDLLKHEQQTRFIDYKTQLQEIVQQDVGFAIEYRIVSESGPDHDKLYNIAVNINGKLRGHGLGKSKKEAEQLAAKQALSSIAISQ